MRATFQKEKKEDFSSLFGRTFHPPSVSEHVEGELQEKEGLRGGRPGEEMVFLGFTASVTGEGGPLQSPHGPEDGRAQEVLGGS